MRIPWQAIQRFAPDRRVATGVTASELPAESASPFARLDRPAVLLVGEQGDTSEEMEGRLAVLFTNERICSGMRAFQALRMTALDAGRDPFVAEQGEDVPRLLVIDPVEERIVVLEGNRLRASALFKAMDQASKRVWKERLDRTVKSHLKLLVSRDRFHDLLTVAQERLEREDDARDRAAVEAEIQALEQRLTDLRVEETTIWTLTRKWTPPASWAREPESETPGLPPGWREHKAADGRPYYERPDGTTTWDRPAAR